MPQQPLELADAAIGKRVLIVSSATQEFYGTLTGFDEFVNVVLDDATEYELVDDKRIVRSRRSKMLINGHNISLIVPAEAGTPAAALIETAVEA